MNFYTTEQMIEFLDDQDTINLEWADCEGMIDAIATRLRASNDHIKFLQQRIELAEKVIGELYLIQEETTR